MIRSLLRAPMIPSAIRSYSIYEPDYLHLLKPKYPQFEALDVTIKGYDFPVLESYQKYLHSVAEYMDLAVEDGWALPPKILKIQRFKPHGTVVDSEYTLNVYERSIQLCNVDAHLYPTFLRLVHEGLPEGVDLNVVQHTEEMDEARYVPDKQLQELKDQLEGMQIQPKKK